MTKSQLLDALAQSANTSKAVAAAFLDALVARTYQEAKKTGEFTLPGLGKFIKQKRKARLGHNPKTGQSLKIAAKTVLKFRVSKTAQDTVIGAPKAKKESAPAAPAKGAKTAAKPTLKAAKAKSARR
jgi:DNA-binding protein HU-beta